jgi:hypothetical protein
MGWQRRYGKRYFYYTRRVGNRFRCDYIGGGDAGEVAAGLIFLAREERREARARRRAELDRERAVLRCLQQLVDITNNLTRATLLLAGLRRHDRGAWRRRRHGTRKCT